MNSSTITTKDKEIEEENYGEILLCTVSVIENSRKLLAQQIASISSNSYWEIGKILYEKKIDSKYGNAIVKRLSLDLKERFPDMGMSTRNLWYMKKFYERYKNSDAKVQRCVAFLPWKHNLLIMSKELDNAAEYAGKMNYYLSLLD